MTRFAYVRDGVVISTLSTDRERVSFKDIGPSLVECEEFVTDGMFYDTEMGFSERPKRSLEEAKDEARRRIAAARYQTENGTLAIGEVRISTDDRAKGLISAAADRARRGVQSQFTFNAAGVTWTKIDAATMIAIDDAVAEFVQRCFEREYTLSQAIDAAMTVEAADAVNW